MQKKSYSTDKDLEAGRLYCKECEYGVDVCTGKKFSRGSRNKAAKSRVY